MAWKYSFSFESRVPSLELKNARPETRNSETVFLCNRNHSRRAFDQRLAALVRDQDATAPARIKAPIGAGDDGLDDKDIAFFDQHVAIARATILRRKQRAVVAVAAPVHKHQAFQAAL